MGLALLLTAPAAAFKPSPGGGGWTRLVLQADGRPVAAALREGRQGDTVLTVIIEGDGEAHDRHGRPTDDPTPSDPAAWKIARAWPAGLPVAWLGRPCQFVQDPACRPADWTSERFSQANLDLASAAIDDLKARTGAARVRLVGWSGGGTVAALLAGRRPDVASLVTIAAPLDLAAWTAWHGISPLQGLDPARAPPPEVPALHLIGSADPVVPPKLAQPIAQRFGGEVVVRRARHSCCWTAAVPAMAVVGR